MANVLALFRTHTRWRGSWSRVEKHGVSRLSRLDTTKPGKHYT